MNYALIFSSRAEQEFLKAHDWYEEQKVGLGKRFQKTIDRQLIRIKENPQLFPAKKKDFREKAVPVFPFVIIYKIYAHRNEILILSIFHTRRNPTKKP